MSGNIRLRATLCLALSLANSTQARADEPRVHTPATPPPAAAADPAADENPCAKHAAVAASWLAATRDVRAAERAIEALEANPVLASHTTCSNAAISAGRCTDEIWYSREEALERARGRLAAAEENVTAVEESARVAGVPMRCLVDPSD